MHSQVKKLLASAIGLWLGAYSIRAAQSASDLLDEIIRHPGLWSQMCSGGTRLPYEVPIPLYSLAVPRYHSLSKESIQRLQKRRPDVTAEIVSRLRNVDLSKPPKGSPGSGVSGFSGQDPRYLNSVMLQIVFELKIVEALPELLRLEADLASRLQGENVPALDFDGPVMFEGATREQFDGQKWRTFVARIYQRELLAVMTSQLREERFEPLLKSDIEAAYRASLEKAAQSPELATMRRPEDIRAEDRQWITFDPIYNLPRWGHGAGSIPYTDKARLEIRQWVEDYLKANASRSPAGPGKAVKAR